LIEWENDKFEEAASEKEALVEKTRTRERKEQVHALYVLKQQRRLRLL
jgi:hypothetical protein